MTASADMTAAPIGMDRVQRCETMVRAMCAAADNADGDTFASYFAANATYRFANNDPLVGPAAIASATCGIVDAVWPVRHQIDQIAMIGSQLFCRFTIHVSKPGGTHLPLPCVTVIELDDNLIVDYRVHMDITPALRHSTRTLTPKEPPDPLISCGITPPRTSCRCPCQ